VAPNQSETRNMVWFEGKSPKPHGGRRRIGKNKKLCEKNRTDISKGIYSGP